MSMLTRYGMNPNQPLIPTLRISYLDKRHIPERYKLGTVLG